MTLQLQEPSHVDEPQQVEGYAEVIRKVAVDGRTVIVRRGGTDVAAIISLEYLEVLQDALAREEAQRLAKTLDLGRLAKENPPPQAWFDSDEPKPF